METTKEERGRWLADCGLTPQYVHCREVTALCRDVDTLVETLEAVHDEECLRGEEANGCELGERCPARAVLKPSQGDASIRVEAGEVTVDGKLVEEAPLPVAATCRDCGWDLKQVREAAYTWRVRRCYPEYHLVQLFHGEANGVPVAQVAIDTVPPS